VFFKQKDFQTFWMSFKIIRKKLNRYLGMPMANENSFAISAFAWVIAHQHPLFHQGDSFQKAPHKSNENAITAKVILHSSNENENVECVIFLTVPIVVPFALVSLSPTGLLLPNGHVMTACPNFSVSERQPTISPHQTLPTQKNLLQ